MTISILPVSTIMVDELRVYDNAWGPFRGGSCHLTVDSDASDAGAIEALHAFAARIGMSRSWFQKDSSVPHYDLTPERRARAIAAGAEVVSARDQALRRLRRRSEKGPVFP